MYFNEEQNRFFYKNGTGDENQVAIDIADIADQLSKGKMAIPQPVTFENMEKFADLYDAAEHYERAKVIDDAPVVADNGLRGTFSDALKNRVKPESDGANIDLTGKDRDLDPSSQLA